MGTKIPATIRGHLQFKPEPTKAGVKKAKKSWTMPEASRVNRNRLLQEQAVTGPFSTMDNHPSSRDRFAADSADIPVKELSDASVNSDGYAVVPLDPSADSYTDEHNEYMYEEIVDPETGVKDILERNNYLDRIV